MVIPKPLCQCRVCVEARQKGRPFARTGPSAFLHDENILIDTPAEIAWQLNRTDIKRVDYLLFTHLDPDHVEGFRLVEQVAVDFRTWKAYPDKKVTLIIPDLLFERLKKMTTVYGSQIEFYHNSGFIDIHSFDQKIRMGDIHLTALPVNGNDQVSYVYVFEKKGRKIVYAPCDIKPFPVDNPAVRNADVLFIQPGIIEGRLKHNFVYPADHISRTTLYTMDQTIALSQRIGAKKTIFIHLEEYWNLGFSDYCQIESALDGARFAWDGMHINTEKEEKHEFSNQ